MPEHVGVQLAREVADALCECARALLERRDVRLHVRDGPHRGHASLEAAERDGQGRKLLAHVVVEIAGDPRPLHFLGSDQPSGQVLQMPGQVLSLAFCLPLLGDVGNGTQGEIAFRCAKRTEPNPNGDLSAVLAQTVDLATLGYRHGGVIRRDIAVNSREYAARKRFGTSISAVSLISSSR